MTEEKSQNTEINWQDFNYPPLLKMMHFVPSEIKQHRFLILLRFSVHWLLIIEGLLNIINNSIQTAQGESGLRILYSFLFCIIFIPTDLLSFYRAYAGILKDKSMLGIYTYLEPILFGLWVTFAIANFLGFNGFVQVSHLYKWHHALTGTLSLIQSILFSICAIISAFCYVKICKVRNQLTATLINTVV